MRDRHKEGERLRENSRLISRLNLCLSLNRKKQPGNVPFKVKPIWKLQTESVVCKTADCKRDSLNMQCYSHVCGFMNICVCNLYEDMESQLAIYGLFSVSFHQWRWRQKEGLVPSTLGMWQSNRGSFIELCL